MEQACLVCKYLDLVVCLGVNDVDVPYATSWDACITLKGALSMFLISCKVGHMLVAWTCFPHREHGGMSPMVGVLVMMRYFNIC